MKKALVVVAAIVLVVALVAWVLSWFWAEDAVATSGARPWPGGMGTLHSATARLPPLKANDASVKLTGLANALPKNETVADFVGREIAQGELTIGQPPVLPEVSAIGELLLREPVAWERHEEFDHASTAALREVQMTMCEGARRKRADESARERSRGVGGAARRVEARALAGRAQMMAQTAALSRWRG